MAGPTNQDAKGVHSEKPTDASAAEQAQNVPDKAEATEKVAEAGKPTKPAKEQDKPEATPRAPLEAPNAELLRGTLPSRLDPTAKTQVVPDDQTPNPVQVAVGVQSDVGSSHVKFYDSLESGSAEVDLDSVFKPVGQGGTTVETSSAVWEEYLIPNTTTPVRRLMFPAGVLVPVDIAESVKQAAKESA